MSINDKNPLTPLLIAASNAASKTQNIAEEYAPNFKDAATALILFSLPEGQEKADQFNLHGKDLEHFISTISHLPTDTATVAKIANYTHDVVMNLASMLQAQLEVAGAESKTDGNH